MCQDYENSFTECDDSEEPELCAAPGCGRRVCRKHRVMLLFGGPRCSSMRPFCAQCASERQERAEAAAAKQLREDRNLSILLNTLAHANGVMSNGILQLYSTGERIDIGDLVRKTGRVA